MTNRVLIAIIVILIILLIYSCCECKKLDGFYSASDEFLNVTKIDSMYLYIGKSRGLFRKIYSGYLYISPDVSNQLFELTTNPFTSQCTIVFEDEQIFPENITVGINDGKLLISDEDTVYGLLYKDTEITHILSAF